MRIDEHLSRADVIAQEQEFLRIPGRLERVLAEIGSHKRVLDIGCGSGRVSRAILEKRNQVWGLELNTEAAELARQAGVQVTVGDAELDLPYADASFDFVHAGHVLESIYDTRHLFREVRRVLKPGGAFLFSVPNLNSLENRIRILKGDYLAAAGVYPEDTHGERIRWFNPEKIRDLCEGTGFRVVRLEAFAPVVASHPWLAQGLRFLVRGAPSLGSVLFVRAEPCSD